MNENLKQVRTQEEIEESESACRARVKSELTPEGLAQQEIEYQAWRRLLGRVRVEGPMPVQMRLLDRQRRGGPRISFQILISERDTCEPIAPGFCRRAPHYESDEERLQFLREHIRSLYWHEIDEQLTLEINGLRTRPFDPHVESADEDS